MSHTKERKEKNCLNCNAHVQGRFCHVCGQENVEPKQTFWHLLTHVVYDVTHFDGKFFSSLNYLLFKPGLLSHEYLRGRRTSYLDPVRMYIFTSAVFFIIFFSFINSDTIVHSNNDINNSQLEQQKLQFQKQLATTTDNTKKQHLKNAIAGIDSIKTIVKTNSIQISFDDKPLPASVTYYDSVQNKLPSNKKDGWFTRLVTTREIALNSKYQENKYDFFKSLSENFVHSIPQMMFVSLPLVALILQLLYIRRKQFFYVNHTIFTLHVYIAAYILILISYLFSSLYDATQLSVFSFLKDIATLLIFIYTYKAMRNFYEQRRAKTILKFIIFFSLYGFVLILLIMIFFISSILKM